MKLLSLTVNKNDSTSFYRANGVLHDLKNHMHLEITSLDFMQLKNMSWASLVLYDVVFMQRPYQDVANKMALYCRELNIPVWVDFDDHLLDIPYNNRAYHIFSKPEIHKNIIDIMKLASVITVSTKALKETYKSINENIHVIPNGFNSKMFPYRVNKIRTNKTLLWRGSETHNLDIFYYANPLFKAQEKYKEWEFLYFGYNPWFVPEAKNKKYLAATDPVLYFKELYKLSPKLMQVPLLDTLFNRCKSNIAYIEGSFAGAVCLVPAWEEWDLPGTVQYKDEKEFGEKLELMLNEKMNLIKYNAQAWEYIWDNLRLEKINIQRMELLYSLL